jgi:hypothetical protein
MRKLRSSIAVLSGIILIAFLIIFDYKNFYTKSNLGFILGMISACCNIVAMILSNKHEEREENKKTMNT